MDARASSNTRFPQMARHGENHGKAKITAEIVIAIRAWASKEINAGRTPSWTSKAAELGVSESSLRDIVYMRTWKSLEVSPILAQRNTKTNLKFRSKLSPEIVVEIRSKVQSLISSGLTVDWDLLAQEYGVCYSTLRSVVSGKSWFKERGILSAEKIDQLKSWFRTVLKENSSKELRKKANELGISYRTLRAVVNDEYSRKVDNFDLISDTPPLKFSGRQYQRQSSKSFSQYIEKVTKRYLYSKSMGQKFDWSSEASSIGYSAVTLENKVREYLRNSRRLSVLQDFENGDKTCDYDALVSAMKKLVDTVSYQNPLTPEFLHRRNTLILSLRIRCKLRSKALLRLRISDIESSKNTITIGMTDINQKIISLDPVTRNALSKYLKIREKFLSVKNNPREQSLLVSMRGMPMSEGSFRYFVDQIHALSSTLPIKDSIYQLD